MKHPSRVRAAQSLLLSALVATALAVPPACGAELHKETIEVFDRYIQSNDQRFEREIKAGPFLWMDGQPKAQRAGLYEQLRGGGIVFHRVALEINGKEIEVPDGIIHHWLGVVFVPGVTLQDALRLFEDYDNHAKTFAPDVMRSKLLEHNGHFFRSYLRFYKKKVFTVVLDTEHEATYDTLNLTRAVSRSRTTHINEVENHDEADERLKPEGRDGGFLWRLNNYWRFEETEGGTFVQCEAVTLTRDIPFLLKPIVGPYITSVPRESLFNTLTSARRALVARRHAAPSAAP